MDIHVHIPNLDPEKREEALQAVLRLIAVGFSGNAEAEVDETRRVLAEATSASDMEAVVQHLIDRLGIAVSFATISVMAIRHLLSEYVEDLEGLGEDFELVWLAKLEQIYRENSARFEENRPG